MVVYYSSSSGQLLSCEAMLLFAASCRLIASMTPRTLDLLVNLVCFDVFCRTVSKTGSPGRSFFSNCLPVNSHRIDAIIFQVSFNEIFIAIWVGQWAYGVRDQANVAVSVLECCLVELSCSVVGFPGW